MRGCVGPFPHSSCWSGVGSWFQGSGAGPLRGQSQRKSSGMSSPEAMCWERSMDAPTAMQHPGAVSPWTQQGGGRSRAGPNWVPNLHLTPPLQVLIGCHLLIPYLLLRIIPVRSSDPGQRHWNSQGITISLCCSLRNIQGAAPMGCPGPAQAGGIPISQQVFPPTLPPFQSRQGRGSLGTTVTPISRGVSQQGSQE